MTKFYSEDDESGSWTRCLKGKRSVKKPKYGYLEMKPANWLDSRTKNRR
jgi:hypothetical protein